MSIEAMPNALETKSYKEWQQRIIDNSLAEIKNSLQTKELDEAKIEEILNAAKDLIDQNFDQWSSAWEQELADTDNPEKKENDFSKGLLSRLNEELPSKFPELV